MASIVRTRIKTITDLAVFGDFFVTKNRTFKCWLCTRIKKNGTSLLKYHVQWKDCDQLLSEVSEAEAVEKRQRSKDWMTYRF